MRAIATALAAAGLAAALAACGGTENRPSGGAPAAPEKLRLTSTDFTDGGTLPERFTCDGDGTSPPLRWSGVPKDATELALLVEDPDAPGGIFVHWTVFDIQPSVRSIDAGAKPPGSLEGTNTSGDDRYVAPCPPKGDDPHRYVFTIYALKEDLALEEGAQANEIHSAIAAAAAARGQLTGTFGRR